MIKRKDWLNALNPVFKTPEYKKLYNTVMSDKSKGLLATKDKDIFEPFNTMALKDVKVVIVGNSIGYHHCDNTPYAFASANGKLNGQSTNFFSELRDEYNSEIDPPYDLHTWREQGVLMFNVCMTARKNAAPIHTSVWKPFAKEVLKALYAQPQPIVFLLLGSSARDAAAGELKTLGNKCIITLPSPSPLSAYRGFFESDCFKKCNEFLELHNVEPIDWFKQN